MGESTRDDAWFEALYRRHAPAVLAYARRRLSDTGDCEDVVVDVFAVAWRRRTDIPADELPWLYATAGNVVAHLRRSRTRQDRLGTKLATQGLNATTDEPHLPDDYLQAALRSLSEPDQEVLRLWAWEDLDGTALASALGCAPGAARTRLHRAKTRLRTAMTTSGKAGTA